MTNFPWKYEKNNTSLTIYADKLQNPDCGEDGCTLKITAVTDRILHFSSSPYDSFAIENPPLETGNLHEIDGDRSDCLFLSAGRLILCIDPDLHINIYDCLHDLICGDYTGPLPQADDIPQEELEQMIQEGHLVYSGEETCRFQIYKQLSQDEVFYGLGDKTGFLNKRGYDYMMWNSDNPNPQVENPTFKAMYKSIPFLISLRKNHVYGIFLDNTHKTFFDLGYSSPEYYSFGAADGELNYYFFDGDTIPEIVEEYTSLTGRSPLPQLWTLGYHQSRWSYDSADEVLKLAKTFRQHHIPCDAIHLDIDYMEDFKIFTTDKKRFPDLHSLSDQLGELGIKLVTIIDPGTKAEKGYSLYEEGLKNGYFAQDSDGQVYHNIVWPGDSVFPDFTSEAVREWWGSQMELLLQQGIRGIWNDMNEPASFQGSLPDEVLFPGDNHPRRHREVHNIYGHLMAKATYEGLKKLDGRRPFVITRACYSGSQKYTTAWTGDNQSIWSHLKMSIPQLLNLGISGMPFVGTDIGGFGSNTTPELLCRWIEASCFAPLFRNHCAKYSRRQEPWQFDQQTLDINRKYIKLHYKFLPYLYDLCYEQSKTGIPVLRPLVMHYQADSATWECNDEYLFGPQILVAPVTDQGATARMVYLPEGDWIDYWSGKCISGKQYILREAPLDCCPIYMKAGSLLPVWPETDHVPENGMTHLIMEYYPAPGTDTCASTSYVHYQDNGSDFSYQQGAYNLYTISVTENQTLSVEKKHAGYQEYKEISLSIRESF